MSIETKIIAIDDDPTGSQTVHSCLLLTRWDPQTLTQALEDASPLFFVLSNTRSMEADRAAAVTREICRNLRSALEGLAARGRPINPLVVSRSDSTLRGHYPVETDVIAEELGPFDAHFLVPAFFEGGRITRDSVHYLLVDGQPVPVSETEFARDSVFGYRNAYLPDYVEEKTGGRIPAARVSAQLTSTTDLFATVASVVGFALPDEVAVDSFDLLPVLLGVQAEDDPVRPHLLTQSFRGEYQLRRGHWKYLDHRGSGGNDYSRGVLAPYALPELAPEADGQLYDLANDPGETRNLFFEERGRREEMQALLAELTAPGGRSAPRNRRPLGLDFVRSQKGR